MKNRLEKLKAQVKEIRNKKGFTLIELIVVIAVLGILVLLAAPKFLGYTQDANVATMKADAKVLENASLVYHVEQEVNGKPGTWPVDDTKEFTLAHDIHNIDVNGSGTVEATDVLTGYSFDAKKLGDKVKTLKGDLSNYALTADGEVFYVGDSKAGTKGAGTAVTEDKGVKDSKGNKHFGVRIEKVKTP